MRFILAPLLVLALAGAAPPPADLHAPLDKILDTYVREGNIYYHALQIERRPLDGYLASLDIPAATVAAWPKAEQLAFWINAYNAFVLETVIDTYPIKGTSPDFPSNSIMQIPGAFQTRRHRVAGQSLTLNGIEDAVVAMGDARALLALGRGAVGSGRLKSEAYQAARLESQLDISVKEFVRRVDSVRVDPVAKALIVSPLFAWRREAFIASFAAMGERWTGRTPLEQAIAGMSWPKLFESEREFLLQNTFQMQYGPFNWRLNDLAGGQPH